jgi:hypothetical protein
VTVEVPNPGTLAFSKGTVTVRYTPKFGAETTQQLKLKLRKRH